MKNKLWVILILGIILRIFLSLTTFHPDLQAYDLAGLVLKNVNPFDFYNYLYSLPKDDLILKSYPPYIFNYPPLAYLFLGGMSLLFTVFSPQVIHLNFLFNISQVLGDYLLSFHLLALKLPYFIFDLGCAYLLMKLFQDPKSKILSFGLWMFNPINLYATYMIGQHDIIPTFFVIVALYFANISNTFKNLSLAAVALGIGASFKIFPFLFLIPVVFLSDSWSKRLKLIGLGILPYLLFVLPFLGSVGYRMNALVANQTDKSFYAQIPISGGESIIIFVSILLFFYFLFLYKKISSTNLWQHFFIVGLLFFILTHYHPQWLLWLSPLLIIESLRSKFKNTLASLTLFLSWFSLLFFFDSSLTIGLFAPVFPDLYQSQTLWQILGINIDYNFARSILQSVFTGAAIYFIYSYFPSKSTNS